jgi:hypothetical protein
VNPDFLDAYLDAIATIRATINSDTEASRILQPPDDDGTIDIAIPALAIVAAAITTEAAAREGITTAEYLDRLTRWFIMNNGTAPGGSDGGLS